jgi:hypothetical protein
MSRVSLFTPLPAALACIFLVWGGIASSAADLPLPPPLTRLQKPTATLPPPVISQPPSRMHDEQAQKLLLDQNHPQQPEPIANLKPAPLIAARTAPVIVAPLPALTAQQVASNDLAPNKATQAEPFTASTGFMSSLGGLPTFLLVFIAALNGFFVLPIILRGFDALLAAPLECDVSDAPFAQEANATVDDLQDFAHSELTAADIRKQTEVLRALKDTLDAELESVRATIRRERARAEPKDTL